MTRNELITKWCAAEGGKVSALDAPQAREAYAKLRAILLQECLVDIDDVIKEKDCANARANFARGKFVVLMRWNLPSVKRKPAKAARRGK